tara:strand:- start:136 stop:354 length:219 start_codon:yes stop_codon:yes gene_type:complete
MSKDIKRIITLLDRALKQDNYEKLKEESRKEDPNGRVCYPALAGGCRATIRHSNKLITKAINQLKHLNDENL